MHAEEADANHSTKKFSCFRGPKSDHFLASSVCQCRVSSYWILFKLDLLLHGFLQVVTWICHNWHACCTWIWWNYYMDMMKLFCKLPKLFYMFISGPVPNKTKLTKISKLDEASALTSRLIHYHFKVLWKGVECWSTQCLGYVVPLAMFFIGPESDHWLCLSLTNSLTNSLTPV